MLKIMPNNLTLINEINFHDKVLSFIHHRHMDIQTYEDMKEVYIKMLENNYFFILNPELKLHMMLDLTYNLNQTQENRVPVLDCLDVDDSDDESEDTYQIRRS